MKGGRLLDRKIIIREQLKKLADEAFDAEDYKTLKQLRIKILEYDKTHKEKKETPTR